jgi:hypothetical protein
MDDKKIKNFSHNEKEICNLCRKPINTKTERWNVILGYSPDETEKGFYHYQCLNDFMKDKSNILQTKFKSQIASFTRGMLKNLKSQPYKNQEVYTC